MKPGNMFLAVMLFWFDKAVLLTLLLVVSLLYGSKNLAVAVVIGIAVLLPISSLGTWFLLRTLNKRSISVTPRKFPSTYREKRRVYGASILTVALLLALGIGLYLDGVYSWYILANSLVLLISAYMTLRIVVRWLALPKSDDVEVNDYSDQDVTMCELKATSILRDTWIIQPLFLVASLLLTVSILLSLMQRNFSYVLIGVAGFMLLLFHCWSEFERGIQASRDLA